MNFRTLINSQIAITKKIVLKFNILRLSEKLAIYNFKKFTRFSISLKIFFLTSWFKTKFKMQNFNLLFLMFKKIPTSSLFLGLFICHLYKDDSLLTHADTIHLFCYFVNETSNFDLYKTSNV